MRLMKAVAAAVVLSLTAAPLAHAQRATIVERSDLDRAVAARVQADEVARASVRALLEREDVRAMAQGLGVDVRRAESAVATLDGEELRQAAAAATAADHALAGGLQTVTLSLVSLLLIIIIVILLAD
jgi:hypothetical protein